MKSILKNSNGKAVSTGGKLLGSPEGVNPFQTFVTGKGSNAGYDLFKNYKGENVDFISDIDFSANETCYSMFELCSNLQTIPLFDTSNVTRMDGMFRDCTNLQTISLLDTSNVTNMNSMFSNCKNLQTIPQLNTSNVTNMSNMFYCCFKLTTIPQLDTSNVTNMYYMFASSGLRTIPQLDTSNVTSMAYMFVHCSKLQTIDLTSLDKVGSTGYISETFKGCSSLTKLIIRTMTKTPLLNTNSFTNCYHFLGTVNSTYNPEGLKDGRIYVPDNMVEQLKTATNWSAYADIIVPLSTLEE